MRKLRRNRNKKQIRVVLGMTICLLMVMTVGYAAFSTNLTLNAKGNVIYVEKTTSETLTKEENLASNGADGLYKETDSEGNTTGYVYKGANPNNYITIADEEYRIMGIETDGTIKIIRNEQINSEGTIGRVFDPGYGSSIEGITSSGSSVGTRYLQYSSDYCYNYSLAEYAGCKVWSKQINDKTITEGVILDRSGTPVSQMPLQADSTTLKDLPTTDAYLNTYLNNTYLNSLTDKLDAIDTSLKNKIVTHTFNVGPVKSASGQTLETDIEQESAYKWKGKVGLMTASDYAKANTNTETCGTVKLSGTSSNAEICKETNYLAKSYSQWTISPISVIDRNSIWVVSTAGWLGGSAADMYCGALPVLYLSSDIELTGTGEQGTPYQIS